MIDPLLGLTFNLHAQKGTYALLLGSGVSRSASIPTGWEVTLDLINRVAHLQGESCEGDESRWYAARYGKEPDYSEVLSEVSPTSAAQQLLLKGYFEPTSDEREEGKKLPTAAHLAVAKLVRAGHFKVIVTTNFDRLVEIALEGEGIAPVVVASADAAKGAPPLAHSRCTIIKVHGDYLDHRIKNSPRSLARYDKAINRILDQIFDEYGLIICGWSGDYDAALRKALERSKSRRYPMYWTVRSEPSGIAKNLIALHKAHLIKIEGADTFFTALLEKVDALDEFARPHPLSTEAAIVTLKKYLSEDKHRIALRDLLVGEAEQVGSVIDLVFADLSSVVPTQQTAQDLMKRIEAVCEKLVHLFATGSFHAKPDDAKAFFDAFHLIVIRAQSPSGYIVWSRLRRYCALLLTYASGIGAVASENYSVLCEIARRSSFIKHDEDKNVPAPVRIHAHSVMERDVARQLLPGMDKRHTPVSDYLFAILREPFKRLIPDDNQYERIFDNFEYLWCLLHVDAEKLIGSQSIWTPYGAFCWRRRGYSGEWFKDEVKRVTESCDKSWPPLKDGLFGGSIERLSAAFNEAQPRLDEISSRYIW